MKKKFLVGALLFCVLAAAGAAWFVWSLNARVEGQYFDSNGVRIHYTVEGEGEPVILIHGFCANADLNWRKPGITERLAREYRVIAIDNRGHGLSDKPHDPAQYGVEMVKDVIRLMDHLEIGKAHIIGYSMGGYLTMKLLTMYPDRVISAAPCGAGWPRETPERRALMADLQKALAAGDGITPLMKVLAPKGKNVSPWREWMVNTTIAATNDLEALAALVQRMPDFAVTEEELRRIPVPVLSVVGSIDPLREDVDALEGLLQQHEVVFVDQGDHLTTVGNKAMADALVDFLHRHSATEALASTPVAALRLRSFWGETADSEDLCDGKRFEAA